MLENSLVFFASEISDGDWHNHNDMPVLLAGGNAGKLRTGEHLRLSGERSFGDLFLSFAHSHDIELETFCDDGTQPLDEISLVQS